MAQTLPFEQGLTRQAQPDTGFGLRPVLGVLLAFLAIHSYLAMRLPLAHMEAHVLLRDHRLLVDLPHHLALLGTSLTETPDGARIGFVLASVLTSLVLFAATRLLTEAPLAPAIAVIWLNTTLLFGIGSVFATRETLAALGLTIALYGLAAARHGPGMAPWLAALVGLCIAAASHASAPFALLAVPLAMLPDKASRNWVRSAGFGVFVGLSLLAAWSSFGGFQLMSVKGGAGESIVASLILLGPGLLFFGLVALIGILGPAGGTPSAVAVPFAMMAGGILAVTGGIARVQDLAMLAPLLAAAAAVAASRGTGGLRDRVAEISTPLSFLLLLFAVYVTSVPTNSFLPRLEPVSRLFGWQDLARQVDARAEASGAAYVLVDDDRVARALLGATGRPVLFADPRTTWAVPDCSAPGLFLTRLETANAMLGNFRQISSRGDLPRMAGAWAVDLFAVYSVADPTRQVGCTRPTAPG